MAKRLAQYRFRSFDSTGAAADDPAAERIPPNPDGKLGGVPHQQAIKGIVADIESRGLQPVQEYKFSTPNSSCSKGKRFADVVALDSSGRIVDVYQVGRVNAGGDIVPREGRAAEDIINSPDNPNHISVDFVPYNAS